PVLSSFSCTFDSRSPSSFPTRRSSDLVIFIVVTIGIFWAAGERAKWSPDFSAQPLAANVVKNDNPAVVEGARLFHDKGCEFCHAIGGQGGERGPDLTNVGTRMNAVGIAGKITNG